jgi:hypothetical protein
MEFTKIKSMSHQISAQVLKHSPVLRDDLWLVGLHRERLHPPEDRVVPRRGLPVQLLRADGRGALQLTRHSDLLKKFVSEDQKRYLIF